MPVIDERGRLFGRVNVVDALVVVFAVAVLIAGATLVFGADDGDDPAPPEPAPLHVTVATGDAAATDLQAGETVTVRGTNTTVTDVHRTVRDDSPYTLVRLELTGERHDDRFRLAGDPVRRGETLGLVDETFQSSATVIEREVPATFETATTAVTVEATVHAGVADAVAPGDTQYVGDTAVATVTGVDRTTHNDTHRTVRLDLELATRLVDDTPLYGERPVRLGRPLTVATDRYEFTGTVVASERP